MPFNVGFLAVGETVPPLYHTFACFRLTNRVAAMIKPNSEISVPDQNGFALPRYHSDIFPDCNREREFSSFAISKSVQQNVQQNMNSMKLVSPLHSLYWSIHTKDESKRGTAFAFIFGVN